MGNTLCKDRSNQTDNTTTSTKSPIDRVLGRCAQICPRSIGKQKHFWDKQVLETSAPLQTQPKMENSGYQSAPLTVPDSPKSTDGHPIAPPRKKRPSMIHKENSPTTNAFRENFVGKRTESETTTDSQGDIKDFSDFEKMPLNQKSEKTKAEKPAEDSKSQSEEEPIDDEQKAATLVCGHRVPSFGDKKSDKFFGENLSDCLSNEPLEIVAAKTESEDKPVEKPKTKEEKKISLEEREGAIKKELIASLALLKDMKTDSGVDEPDRVQVAVEEPVITKTIITRHVCDDEEELRHHLHHHHHDHDDDHDHDHNHVVPDPNAPKKPQRDFTRYKRSAEDRTSEKSDEPDSKKDVKDEFIEASDDLLSQIEAELIKSGSAVESTDTKAIQTELIKPSSAPESADTKVIQTELIKPSSAPESTGTKAIQAELIKPSSAPESTDTKEIAVEEVSKKDSLTRASESTPSKLSESEKILRRCLSTQSYLTPDLVEEIAKHASSLSHHYLPEDYSSCNDGSNMAPNSKLEQKRTLSTQSSQVDQQVANSEAIPVVEPVRRTRPLFTIGSIQSEASFDDKTLQSPTTTPIEEVVTPPVYAKFRAPAPLVAKDDSVKEVIIEKVLLHSPELKDESKSELRQILKPETKQESPNEDISKAIKHFLENDHLKPEDILVLLEEEFGELLHSSTLPQEDRKVIEDLRNIVDKKLDEMHVSIAEKKDNIVEITNIPQVESFEASAENETKPETDTIKMVKLETILSPATVPKSPTDDKRRHSIDEFDHWFAGNLSQTAEAPERKRKRELSLPNCLESQTIIEELIEIKDAPKDDQTESDDDMKEVTQKIITTVITPIIEPIQEQVEIITVTTEANTPNQESDSATIEEEDSEKTYSHDELTEEQKRKSVGHSLLLKFLDIERSTSSQ